VTSEKISSNEEALASQINDSYKKVVLNDSKKNSNSWESKNSMNLKMNAMVANLCDSSLSGSIKGMNSNRETSLNEEIFSTV
jgi:hypothetical protein